MKTPLFQVSAPGRICLFGEHSDYLGLPVMTMAIDLRMKISATPRRDKKFRILMPDIGEEDAFVPSRALKYQKPRDYLRAGVNVLKRRGFQFQKGFDFEIRSDIPVNAGASSSSALVIAWLKMLLTVEQSSLMWNALEIAKMGFETEVWEFQEAGGRMDHFAIGFGEAIYLENQKPKSNLYPVTLQFMHLPTQQFILADSLEPKKDTVGHIRENKRKVLAGLKEISKKIKNFKIEKTSVLEIAKKFKQKTLNLKMALATLRNRDLTLKAKKLCIQKNFKDIKQFGRMIDAHHKILKNDLKISTPKFEKMIQAAKSAGALGCKVNGSGLGGTMVIYAPGREKKVMRAIERVGGKAYLVTQARGINP